MIAVETIELLELLATSFSCHISSVPSAWYVFIFCYLLLVPFIRYMSFSSSFFEVLCLPAWSHVCAYLPGQIFCFSKFQGGCCTHM
jgi:hypothetical protein